MIDLMRATEAVSGYTIRAWTGIGTDEGVGLIVLVEVTDARLVPGCNFVVFLSDEARRGGGWPIEQDAAAATLQEHALQRARDAIQARTLPECNGHRFDL